jgi:acyl carrier protein
VNEKQTQVLKILAEVLNRPAEGLEPNMHLKDDLGLDSAQSLELLCGIEEAFETEIDEMAAAKVERVSDLLAFAE